MSTDHDRDRDRPARAVMSESARADFAAEIQRVRSTSTGGPLDRAFAGLGLGAVAVGLITCLVAYSQATGFDDVRDQMESLILAIFGAGLVAFGSVLYLRNSVTRFLRFWLLRVIYEQRDLAERDRAPGGPAPLPPGTNHQGTDQAADAPVPAGSSDEG
jgi:hypothetical protein